MAGASRCLPAISPLPGIIATARGVATLCPALTKNLAHAIEADALERIINATRNPMPPKRQLRLGPPRARERATEHVNAASISFKLEPNLVNPPLQLRHWKAFAVAFSYRNLVVA